MRVLIHHDRPQPLRERLLSLVPGLEVDCCVSYEALPAALASFRPQALFHIRFADGPYPAAAVFACPGLAWVAAGGVGVDHLGRWDAGRVTVTNGAGVASEAIAWHVLGAMIALTLRYPLFARQQLRQLWQWRQVGRVRGRVAIVGLGHIGREIARLCKALGLATAGVRARPRPTAQVDRVFGPGRLHEALAEADYVAVATPRTPATLGLIDAAAFAAMKRGAFLIDVSRGGVTVADDLVAALESGRLAGAALDVFDPEPMPPGHPLWGMENVIVTPHSCAVFEGWELAALDLFAENARRRLAGQPLRNTVDPARGY